jgi:hypothetical protein
VSLPFLKDYAMQFVGVPYLWGGDDPMKGFDCSGFVIELLSAVGAFPDKTDSTAQGLYEYLLPMGKFNEYGLGSIAFYGKDLKHISHVAFCLDQYVMLNAGSGDSKTVDLQSAIKQNAFIKMRPIKYRKDFLGVIKPDYRAIGYL